MMDENRPLFILGPNSPYENRGCEAIVRGTVKILKGHFNNPWIVCLSRFEGEQQYQKQCQQEKDSSIVHLSTRRFDKREIIQNFYRPGVWKGVADHFLKRKIPYSRTYNDILPHLRSTNAVVLSIGGDNYSLDYGLPTKYVAFDDFVLKHGRPLFLWGASVGPFSANPDYERYMSKHLDSINGIFARESVTIDYLNKIDVKRNVYPVADPAFMMDPEKPNGAGNDLSIERGAIGINLSPLMAKYVTDGHPDNWVERSASIIQTLVNKTEKTIYLIPHVTENGTNDYIFLQKVQSKINENKKKIVLIPPVYGAAEIKWIISQMSFFAGARTHSTIASLSSFIPTLSFAYSAKAFGINKDIFGHTNYCLDYKQLNADRVSETIMSMLERDASIRAELKKRIPEIKESAWNAGSRLRHIIEMS